MLSLRPGRMRIVTCDRLGRRMMPGQQGATPASSLGWRDRAPPGQPPARTSPATAGAQCPALYWDPLAEKSLFQFLTFMDGSQTWWY